MKTIDQTRQPRRMQAGSNAIRLGSNVHSYVVADPRCSPKTKAHKMIRYLIPLFLVVAFSLRADDTVDARAAFETMQEYQKTDDIRSLELFTKDCEVTFVFLNGTEEQSLNISIDDLKADIRKAIANKSGSTETYSEIKTVTVAGGIQLTATVTSKRSGKVSEMRYLYRRDTDGQMRIASFYMRGPLQSK